MKKGQVFEVGELKQEAGPSWGLSDLSLSITRPSTASVLFTPMNDYREEANPETETSEFTLAVAALGLCCCAWALGCAGFSSRGSQA